MNLFPASSIIIFISSVGLGFFVYLGEKTSKLNRYWLALSFSVAFWGLGLWGVTFYSEHRLALFWQYVLDGVAVFIPILFFNFILCFLEISKEKKLAQLISLAAGTALFILSFSPLFKLGVSERFGFFWIEPGPLYFLFPVTFVFYVLYSAFLLIKRFKVSVDRVLRSQIKYILFATIMGFGGGATNFFPQFFDVYPFGNYFVILYVFFMSYSILRYNLFEIKVIATEFFVTAMSLIFLFNMLTAENLEEWMFSCLLFILVLLFSFLLMRGVLKEVKSREQIEHLATDLKRANEELRALDRAKSEFISIASHQLRTPLSITKGYISMVMEGHFGEIGEKLKDVLSRIYISNERLIHLVNEFLNLSRIEAGSISYNIEKVNIEDILNSLVHTFLEEAKKKKVKLVWKTPVKKIPQIEGDSEKIIHVFSNLIDNALRYTKKGSVQISANMDTQAGKEYILIKVKDTGVGMTQQEKARLFKKFLRGSGGKLTHTSGTGLGLYVAKRIVDDHAGKIWAESKGVNKGSAFFVSLPVKLPLPDRKRLLAKDTKAAVPATKPQAANN